MLAMIGADHTRTKGMVAGLAKGTGSWRRNGRTPGKLSDWNSLQIIDIDVGLKPDLHHYSRRRRSGLDPTAFHDSLPNSNPSLPLV